MSLRDTMNNNPAAVTGGAVVLLLLCLFLVYCQLSGGGPSGNYSLIYYDVASGQVKIVQGDAKAVPTSPLEAGGEVYQARIYSCGECAPISDGMTADDLKAKGMFVAYLERWDPQSLGEFEDSSHEVRSLKSEKWVNSMSNAAASIQDPSNKCGQGKFATECREIE